MNAKEILRQLVSFPVLGGQSNLTIINWIKEYIESFGTECKMVPNEENTKASLHCRFGPAVDGGIILSGHTDVVPVKGQKWDSDPFELTEKGDGKLYARGSCDMKGFIACCLSVVPQLSKSKLSKPIYFAFSYDEEIGCLAAPDLIKDIQSHYQEKIKYALIGEPSLMQPTIGQKGICVFKTTVNGSAGHSSRIKQEVSAIHEVARLIMWLENKMNDLVIQNHIDDRFKPPHTSIHIGKVSGGIAANVIAHEAKFLWDVRVIPMDKLQDILASFETYCKKRENELKTIFPAFEIKTTTHHPPVPPLDTSENDSIVKLIYKATENHQWETVSYAAEAGQFHEAGFESIICGPGSIEQAHRANEFIAEEQIEKCIKMLKNLIVLSS